jgi:hypothetical protein
MIMLQDLGDKTRETRGIAPAQDPEGGYRFYEKASGNMRQQ